VRVGDRARSWRALWPSEPSVAVVPSMATV
jgi:hypothetical protein